jgi:hypothetical protein
MAGLDMWYIYGQIATAIFILAVVIATFWGRR